MLSKVLANTEKPITPSYVAEILDIPKKAASKHLVRWTSQGWLRKVRRGLYIPVPIESETADVPIKDPWLIASEAFSPCYIGGFSAAAHWDLTEQLFQTIVVFSEKHLDSRKQQIGELEFLVKEIPKSKFFGTKILWHGNTKIQISDPTKTIIDILDTPALGGGIRSAADFLRAYLNSEHFDEELLILYGEKNENRTVFKRLGFLIEKIKPELYTLIKSCHMRISKGYSQLDPSVKEKSINTRWRLRIQKKMQASLLEK